MTWLMNRLTCWWHDRHIPMTVTLPGASAYLGRSVRERWCARCGKQL